MLKVIGNDLRMLILGASNNLISKFFLIIKMEKNQFIIVNNPKNFKITNPWKSKTKATNMSAIYQ